MFRICWRNPAKLQVNWVGRSGQSGPSGCLNPEPASHRCEASPSFTKASTFTGQPYWVLYACSVRHFWFSIKTPARGEAAAPSPLPLCLLLWLHQSNRKTICCSQAEPEPEHPTGISLPSLPLLKVGKLVTRLCVWQGPVNPRASASGRDHRPVCTCQCTQNPPSPAALGRALVPLTAPWFLTCPGCWAIPSTRSFCGCRFPPY